LGELLAETEKAKGVRGRFHKRTAQPVEKAPTLAEQGIDKKLSARAEQPRCYRWREFQL
jgi:hypothetical protein